MTWRGRPGAHGCAAAAAYTPLRQRPVHMCHVSGRPARARKPARVCSHLLNPKPNPIAPGEELQARKLGLLYFTAAAGLAPADCLPLYLAAAADPTEPVARRAEELLRKRYARTAPPRGG